MGYRLEISKLKYVECGGKLYGYIADEELEKLKSYQWLLKNNYIYGDEMWTYSFNPRIVLTPEKFKEFIGLYMEDYKKTWGEKYFLENKGIEELTNGKDDILLEWY